MKKFLILRRQISKYKIGHGQNKIFLVDGKYFKIQSVIVFNFVNVVES